MTFESIFKFKHQYACTDDIHIIFLTSESILKYSPNASYIRIIGILYLIITLSLFK